MPDNVATVRGIYEAFGRGDVPAILDCLADDVRWEAWADNTAVHRGVPWLRERHGRQGAGEFFAFVGSNMRIEDFQVLSIMAGDDQVAVEFVIEATIVSTGAHYRDEEMHLWTFNGEGKVIRLRHYADTAKHLQAAGLGQDQIGD
jgi:ketosteroid isomerase-like protein